MSLFPNFKKDLFQEIENKLNTVITAYSFLGKGQCNDVYRIETEEKIYCLKIAHDPKNSNSCELNNIEVEAKIFKQLNLYGVGFSPEFIFASDSYYMYEFVDGISMKEGFVTSEEKQRVLIFKGIADFHFQLSLIKKEDVLNAGVTEYISNEHTLNPNQYDLTRLNSEQKTILQNAYSMYEDSIDSSLPQLLHNDPHDENIFIVNDQPVFIDFGDMIWRDIHYDFSRYVYDYPNYWKIILDEFERLSGYKLNRNRIVAISLLRHLRGLLLGAGDDVLSERFRYYGELFNEEN